MIHVVATQWNIACADGTLDGDEPIGVPYGSVGVEPNPDAITKEQALEWRDVYDTSASHSLAKCGPHLLMSRMIVRGTGEWFVARSNDPSNPAEFRDHNLPMLRVHRAWEAAERIAERNGVIRDVGLEIAHEVIGIIGDGTQRWGHLCIECRTLLVTTDARDLACPTHGALGALGSAILLISFDPVTT